MTNEKLFPEKVQQIGRLISGLNDIANGPARASAQELVQLVMELHGIAVEKMLELIDAHGACGAEIIEQLAHNRTVSSLLVLHGLHPEDVETRVARAVEELAARLRKQEVEMQLLAAGQESVHLRVKTKTGARGSSYSTVRAAIEEAVFEAAPEIASLTIEGLEGKDGSGFVGLDQLLGGTALSGPVAVKAGD